MSASIWTECGGTSEIRPLRSRPWRVVEAQHVVATRKLVDTAAEHELLERLIDASKPPMPAAGDRKLHYLLTTPFRYPPLRHGSRFGTRLERGIWYGSQLLRGAFAEVAFYRLVFLEHTRANLAHVEVELSAFRAGLRTRRGIDLTRPPFSAHERAISSPTCYSASQALGREMRAAGVQAFRYRSARDPSGAKNVGLFDPGAFTNAGPDSFETWHCTTTRAGVDFIRKNVFERRRYRFEREAFLLDGRLPHPPG